MGLKPSEKLVYLNLSVKPRFKHSERAGSKIIHIKRTNAESQMCTVIMLQEFVVQKIKSEVTSYCHTVLPKPTDLKIMFFFPTGLYL